MRHRLTLKAPPPQHREEARVDLSLARADRLEQGRIGEQPVEHSEPGGDVEFQVAAAVPGVDAVQRQGVGNAHRVAITRDPDAQLRVLEDRRSSRIMPISTGFSRSMTQVEETLGMFWNLRKVSRLSSG